MAYFSGSGAHIQQGAGALGMPLWLNGQEVTGRAVLVHGDSPGGADGGVIGAGTDGGALGPGAASALIEDPGKAVTPWGDGVLGVPSTSIDAAAPLQSSGDGSIGTPAGESSPTFLSVGAVMDNRYRLDLTNPATVKEVKTALAFAFPPALTDPALDQAFYADDLWDARATKLTADWVKFFVQNWGGGRDSTLLEAQLVATESGGRYPTPMGIASALSVGVGLPSQDRPIEWFNTNFPILSAFQREIPAVGGDYSKFVVVRPYFNAAERASGGTSGGGMKMSTVALIGLAGVGAIGAALVIGHSRKKRMAANRRRRARRKR